MCGFNSSKILNILRVFFQNLNVKNAELKIVRKVADGSFYVILVGDDQVLKEKEIKAADLEGATIDITLAVVEEKGVQVPKLSIKGADDDAVLYGSENWFLNFYTMISKHILYFFIHNSLM